MIKFCQHCADTGNEKYDCFHGYYRNCANSSH